MNKVLRYFCSGVFFPPFWLRNREKMGDEVGGSRVLVASKFGVQRFFLFLFFGCAVVLLADLLSFLVFISLNRWFKK
jgi:hypothetical protein